MKLLTTERKCVLFNQIWCRRFILFNLHELIISAPTNTLYGRATSSVTQFTCPALTTDLCSTLHGHCRKKWWGSQFQADAGIVFLMGHLGPLQRPMHIPAKFLYIYNCIRKNINACNIFVPFPGWRDCGLVCMNWLLSINIGNFCPRYARTPFREWTNENHQVLIAKITELIFEIQHEHKIPSSTSP